MRKCPACDKWTLEYDDYFGRFRCFNPDCRWMATSSAEREIRLLGKQQRPQRVTQKPIPELGLTLTSEYDSVNDALVFEFGLDERTFDLPEGDGRMIWRIAHQTGSVAGFVILGARALGVSKVDVNIAARKEKIEHCLRNVPTAVASGRATRVLIESVTVTAHSEEASAAVSHPGIGAAFQEALRTFEDSFLNQHTQPAQPGHPV